MESSGILRKLVFSGLKYTKAVSSTAQMCMIVHIHVNIPGTCNSCEICSLRYHMTTFVPTS